MDTLRRFWGLVSSDSYTVKRASALLALTALASNVLGLLRNLVFYWLVPKEQLDVYFTAFTIPNFLFNIIIFGAVSSAFVPIASEMLAAKKERETNELTNQLLSWLTVLFICVSIILMLAMGPLMHLVAHRFDAPRLEETIGISRILLVQSIFFAWSFTVGGYLNSTKRFASYAIAPLLYNLVIIAGGFLAVHYGIIAIAWAVVAGSLAHFGIQYRELMKTSYRPKLDLRFTPHMKEISKLMLPRSISQGTAQLVDGVYTFLGAGLLPSSITIFNAMNDIQTMPIQMVGNSMAVAIFPSLSTFASQGEWEKVNELLEKVLRATLFLLIPAIMFVYVVRAQIVRLYLHSSTWEQTDLAIDTFVAFLIGIIPACFIAILSRVFYALKNTRTPMILSAIAAAIAILYATISISAGGNVINLAIAESILMVTQCCLYGFALYRDKSIKLGIRSMGGKIMSYIFGGLILSGVTWLVLQGMDWIYNSLNILGTHTVKGLFVQLIVASIIGVATFLAYSKAVHKQELQWILRRNFSNEK